MKSGANTQGFTIVETLIYLAVSAAIMVSVLTLVGGSQNKAQFQAATSDVNQQINDIINNVSNGYYSNTGTFTCSASNSGPVIVSKIVGSPDTQGTNKGCIFLGRVIQFAPSGAPEDMIVYDAVGLREVDGQQVTSLEKAKIRLIAPGPVGSATESVPNASSTRTLKNGLTTASMFYDTTNAIGGLAILSDFADTQVGSVDLKSGSQSISIYALNNTTLNQPSVDFVNAADNYVNYVKSTQPEGIVTCFNSGSTSQHLVISLGGSNQSLNTKLEIKDGSC